MTYERPLSNHAKENIQSGARTGAGTDVCLACKGTKEYNRLNWGRCRKCVGLDTKTRAPKTTRSTRIYRQGIRS